MNQIKETPVHTLQFILAGLHQRLNLVVSQGAMDIFWKLVE
jgi:hypothetical protein